MDVVVVVVVAVAVAVVVVVDQFQCDWKIENSVEIIIIGPVGNLKGHYFQPS